MTQLEILNINRTGKHHCTVKPASISNGDPVILLVSGLHRKVTKSAIWKRKQVVIFSGIFGVEYHKNVSQM